MPSAGRRSPRTSYACSATTTCVRTRRDRGGADAPRDIRKDVDGAESTGHVRDVDPPSVEVVRGPEPAPTTESAPRTSARATPPSHSRASAARGFPSSTRSRARDSSSKKKKPRSGSWLGARGDNHSCSAPTWFVVRSPMTRMPRACAAGRATPARRRRRAAGRPRRTSSRRSDACCRRGRSVSGRARRRRARQVVEVVLDSGRSPPNHSKGVSGPRPVGSSSHSRGIAHSGGVDIEPGRREAIREHLVDDGVEMPVRADVTGRDDEVVGVGNVERLHADAVEPCVAEVLAGRGASGTASWGSRHGKRRPPPDVGRRSRARSPQRRSAARRHGRTGR